MNRTRTPRVIRIAAALGIALLAACAPMKTIDANNAQSTLEDFSSGRTQLSNGPGGIGNYVNNRGALHALRATKDWSTLAKRVIQVDYGNDINWFYLGLAAQGLGFDDAAKVYYLKASSAIVHCRQPGGEDCDGFRFPDDIVARLSTLQQARNAAAAPPAVANTRDDYPVAQAAAAAAAAVTARAAAPSSSPGMTGAATAGGNARDVLGVRLGVTPTEAQSALIGRGLATSRFGRANIAYTNPLNGRNEYAQDMSFVNLFAAANWDRNHDVSPKDNVLVLFTPQPGQERAFQISRQVKYDRSSGIKELELMKSLREKYGPPVASRPNSPGFFGVMIWSTASRITPFMNEATAENAAVGCWMNQQRYVEQMYTGDVATSKLQDPLDEDPSIMAAHCGDQFVVAKWIVDTYQQVAPQDRIVYGYEISAYDATLAASGKRTAQQLAARAVSAVVKSNADRAQAKPAL